MLIAPHQPFSQELSEAIWEKLSPISALQGTHALLLLCQAVDTLFQKSLLGQASLTLCLSFEVGMLTKTIVPMSWLTTHFDRTLLETLSPISGALLAIALLTTMIFPKHGLPIVAAIGSLQGYLFSRIYLS